jgi:hypothetical protein
MRKRRATFLLYVEYYSLFKVFMDTLIERLDKCKARITCYVSKRYNFA